MSHLLRQESTRNEYIGSESSAKYANLLQLEIYKAVKKSYTECVNTYENIAMQLFNQA